MKKAVYIVLVFSLILSLLTGCGGSTPEGKSATEEKSNISIKAKITGLEEGDNVMIIGGRIPENPPSGEYRLKDPFKMKVEKNGITLLPIHKEGKWSIEAGAVDYGEIPEFHEITVKEGAHKTLKWELRKNPDLPPQPAPSTPPTPQGDCF